MIIVMTLRNAPFCQACKKISRLSCICNIEKKKSSFSLVLINVNFVRTQFDKLY